MSMRSISSSSVSVETGKRGLSRAAAVDEKGARAVARAVARATRRPELRRAASMFLFSQWHLFIILKIFQRNGSFHLYNLKSKGNIKTIDANIYIHEGNNLSVKSINGKVRLSEKRIDEDSDLKIYSLNGNIIHK